MANSLSGFKPVQGQNYLPAQMNLYQQMFGQVSPSSYTSRLAAGDEGLFGQMEAPAMKQFSQLQGDLASRFSGMGMGARHGSGFKNEMNQQTIDFASQLQAQRMGLQRQAIQDLMGMSNDLLQYEFEPKKKKQSWWEKLLAGGSGVAGAAIGGLVGGPVGAGIGGSIGSQFGQAFR